MKSILVVVFTFWDVDQIHTLFPKPKGSEKCIS